MAHFALIEEGVVKEVIVIPDEYETNGQDYINHTLGIGGVWLQCSYTNRIRGKYPAIGDFYDEENDIFYTNPELMVKLLAETTYIPEKYLTKVVVFKGNIDE